jgi:serine-type D-Ala-D-Ala carboxypeptidase (penicillin-binding protein 5/6)
VSVRKDQLLAAMMISLGLVSTQIRFTQPTALASTSPFVQRVPVIMMADAPVHRSHTTEAEQDLVLPQDFVQTLTAESVMVIDVPSSSILLSKNTDRQTYPASTTKLMTALVARDLYQLDEHVEIKAEAFTQGTTVGFEIGEHVAVIDLLKGLLISSGNDAAFALANHHPQGYEGFVKGMNSLAKELHLNQAHFNNPSGLDEITHQITPRDLALIAKEVMKDPVLKDIVGTKMSQITDNSGEIKHQLSTTNDLLGVVPGVVGVKTGTTPLAGEVLVTDWQHEGREVIIVVMNSRDRYADTKAIINWLPKNYEWIKLD